jgi:hypothetical protein
MSFTIATGLCFLLLSFLLFFVVCIFYVFGHLIGAMTMCNWYLRDINIFPLSKK